MKAVVLKKFGGPNVLEVTDIEEPTPSENQIKVKMIYAGLNWAELLSRKGFYSWAPPLPYTLGMEGVGEVVECGRNIDEVEVGDTVMVAGQYGSYAQYTLVDRERIVRKPEYLSMREGAAFTSNFITAWVGLNEMARVRPGEIGLVHAAAGGVGTATLQLGKAMGLTMYGTSSPGKKKIVEALGATHLTYEGFVEELNGVRPDVIMESIGGKVFKQSFDILSPMGRIVLVGALSLKKPPFWNPLAWIKLYRDLPKVDIRSVLRRSRAFMGLHVGYLLADPPKLRRKFNEMVEVCIDHELRPIVRDEAIFPMSRIQDAHHYFEDRKSVGKVLIDPWK